MRTVERQRDHALVAWYGRKFAIRARHKQNYSIILEPLGLLLQCLPILGLLPLPILIILLFNLFHFPDIFVIITVQNLTACFLYLFCIWHHHGLVLGALDIFFWVLLRTWVPHHQIVFATWTYAAVLWTSDLELCSYLLAVGQFTQTHFWCYHF